MSVVYVAYIVPLLTVSVVYVAHVVLPLLTLSFV
jgi:hypothetical protein